MFGEFSWSDKHYCKTKTTPTYCYIDIRPNHSPLLARTHFSTKSLICFVSSCPIRGEDVLNSPLPSSTVITCVLLLHLPMWRLNQRIGLSWAAPKQLFVSVSPLLNILYAHLRGNSTSYCLRGYYNDKSAHCAEKGGKEKVILTVFHLLSWIQMSYFACFTASATYRLPSQFQQSTADRHWKLSWKRLDWRGRVKSWVFVVISLL